MADETAIEVESREVSVADLTPARVEHGALVRPAASVPEVLTAFTEYEDLVHRITSNDDYQTIQGKRFPKRSALRKLGTAFGVSYEIRERIITREHHQVIGAEFVVRATAPGGRFSDGWGACDVHEKCDRHYPNCKDDCRKHCGGAEGGCDGRKHFSKPEHDIPATAETRAKNRAASELFAMGQVSAEEVDRQDASVRQASPEDVSAIVNAAKRLKEAGGDPGRWPVVLGVTVLEEDPATHERYPAITGADARALIDRLDAARANLRAEAGLADEDAQGPGDTHHPGTEQAEAGPAGEPPRGAPAPGPAPIQEVGEAATEVPAESSTSDTGAEPVPATPPPSEPVADASPGADATPEGAAPAPSPDPQPGPAGEPAAAPARKAQINQLGRLRSDLGMTREDRLVLCEVITGRTVEAIEALTDVEAQWLIGAMKCIRDGHVAMQEVDGAWTLAVLDPTDGITPVEELRGTVFLRDWAGWRGLEFHLNAEEE